MKEGNMMYLCQQFLDANSTSFLCIKVRSPVVSTYAVLRISIKAGTRSSLIKERWPNIERPSSFCGVLIRPEKGAAGGEATTGRTASDAAYEIRMVGLPLRGSLGASSPSQAFLWLLRPIPDMEDVEKNS